MELIDFFPVTIRIILPDKLLIKIIFTKISFKSNKKIQIKIQIQLEILGEQYHLYFYINAMIILPYDDTVSCNGFKITNKVLRQTLYSYGLFDINYFKSIFYFKEYVCILIYFSQINYFNHITEER